MRRCSRSCRKIGFKEIPGFPGYWINREGEVRCTREVKRSTSATAGWYKMARSGARKGKKYMTVGLSVNGRTVTKSLHRLLLLTFVGPCPKGMEACHWNDDPEDNSLSNLRWDTHKANGEDWKRNREKSGIAHRPNAKLTEDDVREIRKLREEGWTTTKIGEKFNVNQTTISRICRRKVWKHVV